MGDYAAGSAKSDRPVPHGEVSMGNRMDVGNLPGLDDEVIDPANPRILGFAVVRLNVYGQ